jgi:hypothetical protein
MYFSERVLYSKAIFRCDPDRKAIIVTFTKGLYLAKVNCKIIHVNTLPIHCRENGGQWTKQGDWPAAL